MKRLGAAIVVGTAIGLALCALGWVIAVRAGPPPSGSDPLMASAMMFEVGAIPLSFVTGGLVYRLKQVSDSASFWHLLDAGQVVLNWILLALLIAGFLTLVRGRRNQAPERL